MTSYDNEAAKERAAWSRLLQPTPRGRYEHARTWAIRSRRRTNFVRRIDREPGGCWVWTGEQVTRRGRLYPVVRHRTQGRAEQKAAFLWLMEEFFPESAGNVPMRTRTRCGNTACVNPLHRADGMVTNNRITAEQAVEIYRHRGEEDPRAVAARYGVSHYHVKAIWGGRSWSEVTGAKRVPSQRRWTTPEVREQILARKGTGPSQQVADEFGIHYSTVLRIWRGASRAALSREQTTC